MRMGGWGATSDPKEQANPQLVASGSPSMRPSRIHHSQGKAPKSGGNHLDGFLGFLFFFFSLFLFFFFFIFFL